MGGGGGNESTILRGQSLPGCRRRKKKVSIANESQRDSLYQ